VAVSVTLPAVSAILAEVSASLTTVTATLATLSTTLATVSTTLATVSTTLAGLSVGHMQVIATLLRLRRGCTQPDASLTPVSRALPTPKGFLMRCIGAVWRLDEPWLDRLYGE
jgi:hypothetical protein